MIDLELVDRSFSAVRDRAAALFGGVIIAATDLACCMTCGFAEIESLAAERKEDEPDALMVGYVFYHQQDTAGCMEGGDLWLCYGALDEAGPATDEQVGHLVAECLREQGFTVEWEGSVKTRICVKAPEVTV
jgi:hypothetical protein